MADELDSLYWARPDAFMAERAKLAAAAKRRGDAAAARRISAARKPTTSAWVVNRLALKDTDTARRLGELGQRLRDAHAAMDGDRIRELSAEQHRLIERLARAAFEAAEVNTPSSSLRDDVTGTLQAAIADPDVRARLGHLARPEQWSGFGAFAEATKPARKTRPSKKPPDDGAAGKRAELAKALAAAERAEAEADGTLSERRAECEAARRRSDEARAALRAAEDDLKAARDRHALAERASRAAAQRVKEAKAQLKRS